MQITTDHDGTTDAAGRTLRSGIEHASVDVSGGTWFSGDSFDRKRDHNAARGVGWFAIFDWCWGDDPQGLLDPHDDAKLFSHDHGHYFPPGGGRWTADALEQSVDVPHPAPFATTGCDGKVAAAIADAMRGVRRDQIRDALARIPASWNVTDGDLEVMGYFLERRAPLVADRLLERFRTA